MTLRAAWRDARANAKARGIAFTLTFEEFEAVWMDSGRWPERGRRADQYCMARFGDTGPYAVDNVRITTCRENHQERRPNLDQLAANGRARKGKPNSRMAEWNRTPKMRAVASATHTGHTRWVGRKHSAETKAKMRAARLRLLGK
jgi:hypothetical protein